MPSTQALPTVDQLRQAARGALKGEVDRFGDQHAGAVYDHVFGPTAILFAREADNDRDAFRAIYFDDAEGDDLTSYVAARYPTSLVAARILDTFGVGTVTLTRSSASAGAGTIWAGTRILASGTTAAEYRVATDTVVGASQTLAVVPIRAEVIGSGVAINTRSGLSLEDPLYDPLWTPVALQCEDGTDFEDAPTYRARVRKTLIDARNGYVPRIVRVCQAAGATFVVAFPSTYGLATSDFDSDHGLNAVYVADSGYASSAALINACRVALDGCRVLGADLWVGGITNTPLAIGAVLNLVDDPGKLDVVPIQRAAIQALLAQLGPSDAGFHLKRSSLVGAVARAHPNIQHAAIPYPWLASTAYQVGDVVVPVVGNGFVYQCTQGGTSGGSQPVFPTSAGATVTDGGAVWIATAYQSTLGIFAGGARLGADTTINPNTFPANLTRYTLASRDVTLTLGSPI